MSATYFTICRVIVATFHADTMRILLLFVLLVFCKQSSVSVSNTISDEQFGYNDLKYIYHFHFHQFQGTLRLKYMVQLQKDIESALQDNRIAPEKKDEIKKMLHKIRSFISYAKTSGCLEKDEEGDYKTSAKTKEKLCSVILYKLKELDYNKIDLNQPINRGKYEEQQLFTALTARILTTIENSMRKYRRIFPFVKTNLVSLCREINTKTVYKTYKPVVINPDLAPPSQHSYPQKVQKDVSCQQLEAISRENDQQKHDEKIYTNAHELSDAVNTTVAKLNKEIDKLDRLIHGVDGTTPATKKENLFIFKVSNIIDFENENVVNAYDNYTALLVESARTGILPILLLYYHGKFHLNHRGGWWGLRAIKYTPLEYALSRKIEEAITALNKQLVAKWLSLKASKSKTKKDKDIYELLVNNEIAASQLILQDPGYGAPVTSLLTQYQDDNRVPKWLQLAKSWTYRLDMLFIPLTIGASLISGGALFPVVAGIAVSINFFWAGVTTTEALIARKKYALMEQALLSGTSVQVERGMKLLREFHAKRRSAVVAGTVGVPLSIPSLKMAVQSVEGLKTVLIDTTAAFASDTDGIVGDSNIDLLGRFDAKSDTELLEGY